MSFPDMNRTFSVVDTTLEPKPQPSPGPAVLKWMLVFAFRSTTVKRLYRPKQRYLSCTTWKSTSVSNKRNGGEARGGRRGRKNRRGRRKWRLKGLQIKHTWMKTHIRRQEVRKGEQIKKEAKRNVENPWQQTWVDPFRPQPCCNHLAQWVWALGMAPKGLGLDPSLWAISLTCFLPCPGHFHCLRPQS